MIKYIALAGIYLYQKVISPNKGYRCAYSLMYGGTGCSGYVKDVIKNESIFKWKMMIKERFYECRESARRSRRKCGLDDCCGCDCTPPSNVCVIPICIDTPDCDPDCGGCDGGGCG